MEQNSVNLMCTGWSRCPITKYSGLSGGTYIDLVVTGSYVTVLYWTARLVRFRFVMLLFYVFWSLRSWKVSTVGDEGSSCTTTGDVQTLLEAFLNMFLGSACFIDEALPVWDSSLQVLDFWDFQIIRPGFNGILLYVQRFVLNWQKWNIS